jgi:hypothetical protein
MSWARDKSFHSILNVIEPVRLPSKGIDDTVSSLPGRMGHPPGETVQRSSVVGERGIKLYVTEYVAVPPVTSLGTSIERRSVEFCPFTGGSGEKERDVRVKRAVDFEQSVTDALAERSRARMAVSNICIPTVSGFMPYALCLMLYVLCFIFTEQMQP